jgi:hypothetical protein
MVASPRSLGWGLWRLVVRRVVSFRFRRRLFFASIVVVPMTALPIVLFLLTSAVRQATWTPGSRPACERPLARTVRRPTRRRRRFVRSLRTPSCGRRFARIGASLTTCAGSCGRRATWGDPASLPACTLRTSAGRRGAGLGPRCLRRFLADIDAPARYVAKELEVILPETDAEGAWRMAERMREAVEALRIPRVGEGAP